MKNTKILINVVLLFVFPTLVFAHGSLELIECHDTKNSLIFRGEALNKKNDFSFKLMKNNEVIWSQKKIRLSLRDSFENNQLIENVGIQAQDGSQINLKIMEVASREIRNGTGSFRIPKLKINETLTCYAVY